MVNSCCRGRSGESDVIIRRSHVTCDVTTDAVNDHQQTVDTRVRVELSLSNCASLLYLFATYTTDELISHVEAGIALSCCTTKPQRKWRASLSCETQHVTICSKPQLFDAIRSHSKPVLTIRTNGPCRQVRVQVPVRVVSTGLHCFRYTCAPQWLEDCCVGWLIELEELLNHSRSFEIIRDDIIPMRKTCIRSYYSYLLYIILMSILQRYIQHAYWHDPDMWVRGHSRSLLTAPIDRPFDLGLKSVCRCKYSIAQSCTVCKLFDVE